MFGLLDQCLRAFGIRGLPVYLRLKTGMTDGIRLPGIKHPLRMRPRRADKISFREIFMKREYDVQLPSAIEPEVIIDGGANVGFTSVFFANRYPKARIFSVEPDESNFLCLVENTKRYSTITPVKSALWRGKESIKVVDRGYGGRGLMIEKHDEADALYATSIGDLMKEYHLAHIDILKLDIEGSEKEVFGEGYESWLPVTKCLIIELHDRMKPGCSKAVFAAIAKYDFSFSIKGENCVFINNQ